ncbi:HAD domain-containing protein [Tenacibaculum maritimum]|uniref:HAD domain-containing protein n=1 Tax=Tenacibaculum maritimum TaxID=107401 RepID=UPI0010A30062|nr:HAD domain-containing protein [Tenacibaculum maritimum]QCD61113.1 hypothetical protein B9C57_00415 [Tenacibaculum maritimum]
MNILFLDIDGVLNSRQWHSSESCKVLGTSVKRFFDPVCVEYLNRIVNETETKVVISSSWRILRSLQNLQDLFKSIGFTGKIFGKTEDLSIFEPDTPNLRGVEIKNWTKDNQKHFKTPIKYIILDDEDDFLKEQKTFFFQTNSDIGLDTSTTEKIISFFK